MQYRCQVLPLSLWQAVPLREEQYTETVYNARAMTKRKFKLIACEVFYREACYLAATSPHQIDLQFLQKGLHDLETKDMVDHMQKTIDEVEPDKKYDAALLGYGRCNDGLVGVQARDIPLVLPRAHDCITVYFGSRQRYKEYFFAYPGTFYHTTGWVERDLEEGEYHLPAYGQKGIMANLGLAQSEQELIEQYGEENARYLMDTLFNLEKNYTNLLYLKMDICDEKPYIRASREFAKKKGWNFHVENGSMSILSRLCSGEWDDDFLIVPSGAKIISSNDDEVIAVSIP